MYMLLHNSDNIDRETTCRIAKQSQILSNNLDYCGKICTIVWLDKCQPSALEKVKKIILRIEKNGDEHL